MAAGADDWLMSCYRELREEKAKLRDGQRQAGEPAFEYSKYPGPAGNRGNSVIRGLAMCNDARKMCETAGEHASSSCTVRIYGSQRVCETLCAAWCDKMEWMYEERVRHDGQMETEDFKVVGAAYRLPEEFLALEQEKGLSGAAAGRCARIRAIFGGAALEQEAAPAAAPAAS